MNKYKINLYMKLLSSPLTNIFIEDSKDLLEEKAKLYENIQTISLSDFSKRQSLKWNYANISKRIIEKCVYKFPEGTRIDDILMTLELLYPTNLMGQYLPKGKDIYRFYLRRIFDTAQAFLCLRNGIVSIRVTPEKEYEYTGVNNKSDRFLQNLAGFNKVELWNILSRQVSEDVYIAAYYIINSLYNPKFLYNQKNRIKLSDAMLDNILKKGIAETHMHFHVSSHFEVSWMLEMNIENFRDKGNFNKHKSSLFAAIFRMVASDFLKSSDSNFDKFIEASDYNELLINIFYEQIDIVEVIDLRSLIMSFFDKYDFTDSNKTDDFLFHTTFKVEQNLDVSAELLFLFYCLKYLKENKHDNLFLRMFFKYLRYKNEFYKRITQPNVMEGLDQFQLFYKEASNSLKCSDDEKKRISHIFKSQSQNYYVKKFEMRITPYVTSKIIEENLLYKQIKKEILSDIRTIIELYLDYIQLVKNHFSNEDLDKNFKENKVAIPTLGIVYHFLKHDDIDNVAGSFCWLSEEDVYKRQSDYLTIWQKKRIYTASVLSQLLHEIPLLSEYLVGIDAASNENDTEPWLFAPIFRACRNRKDTFTYVFDSSDIPYRINNLGFTYHIGEEFRHILSGLRHIDEVLEHFGYRPGDRLGHAIALGIDVEYWMRQNEVVTMPLGEHLDNLLWLWGVLRIDTKHLNVIEDNLELEIMKYAEMIYSDITGITPYLLYQMYQKKFCLIGDSFFEKIRQQYFDDDIVVDNRCLDMNYKSTDQFCKFKSNSKEINVWNIDKLLCTNFCPIYQKQYKKPIFINVNKDNKRLFEAIQSMLIEKVEKMGIYVETNPTSNTSIGEIESMMKHPIFHLNNEEMLDEHKSQVMLTINSDDPLVFNTDTENEISYIYHALIHNGFKRESVLKWIDKIRQYGMDSSFIKQVKLPSVQKSELEKLKNFIDEKLK